MPEIDLTDLRESVAELKREFRAVVLPLLTTTGQLGERIITLQDATRETRDTVDRIERQMVRGERVEKVERRVERLEKAPTKEQSRKRARRERVAEAVGVGAFTSVLWVVLPLVVHAPHH